MKESKGGSRSRSQSRKESPKRQPADDRYPPASKCSKLFVTNIDSKQNEELLREDLHKEFSRFGDIKEVVIKTRQHSDNSFVFVEFMRIEDAEKALEEMRGKMFKGKPLKVEFGNPRADASRRVTKSCYICGRQSHIARDCPDRRSSDRRHRRERSRSYSPQQSRRHRRGRDRSRSRDRRDRDYDSRKRHHSRSRSSQRRRDDRKRSRSRSSRRDRNY